MLKLTVPQKLALLRTLMQPRNPLSIHRKLEKMNLVEVRGDRILLTLVGIRELRSIINGLHKSADLLHIA